MGIAIGRRMREMRLRRGLSLSEVARRMDSYHQIVRRLETDGQVPLLEVVTRYCRAIGVAPLAVLCVLDAFGPALEAERRRGSRQESVQRYEERESRRQHARKLARAAAVLDAWNARRAS